LFLPQDQNPIGALVRSTILHSASDFIFNDSVSMLAIWVVHSTAPWSSSGSVCSIAVRSRSVNQAKKDDDISSHHAEQQWQLGGNLAGYDLREVPQAEQAPTEPETIVAVKLNPQHLSSLSGCCCLESASNRRMKENYTN